MCYLILSLSGTVYNVQLLDKYEVNPMDNISYFQPVNDDIHFTEEKKKKRSRKNPSSVKKKVNEYRNILFGLKVSI